MVTGIRQDAWANANRIQVEEDKTKNNKGRFLTPNLYGQPKENGIYYRPDSDLPLEASSRDE